MGAPENAGVAKQERKEPAEQKERGEDFESPEAVERLKTEAAEEVAELEAGGLPAAEKIADKMSAKLDAETRTELAAIDRRSEEAREELQASLSKEKPAAGEISPEDRERADAAKGIETFNRFLQGFRDRSLEELETALPEDALNSLSEAKNAIDQFSERNPAEALRLSSEVAHEELRRRLRWDAAESLARKDPDAAIETFRRALEDAGLEKAEIETLTEELEVTVAEVRQSRDRQKQDEEFNRALAEDPLQALELYRRNPERRSYGWSDALSKALTERVRQALESSLGEALAVYRRAADDFPGLGSSLFDAYMKDFNKNERRPDQGSWESVKDTIRERFEDAPDLLFSVQSYGGNLWTPKEQLEFIRESISMGKGEGMQLDLLKLLRYDEGLVSSLTADEKERLADIWMKRGADQVFVPIETVKKLGVDGKHLIERFQSSVASNNGLRNAPLTSLAGVAERLPEEAQGLAWNGALRRLEKIQARAANESHDPWKTELDPLLQSALEKGTVSVERPEDAEHLLDFVKENGAINAPQLFELFVRLRQARTKEELPPEQLAVLGEALGEKRLEKLTAPDAVLNEIRQFKRKMIGGLLRDEVPPGVDSKLGREVFAAAIGSGAWGKLSEFEPLVARWKLTAEQSPEQARAPEGYEEVRLEVPRRTRGKEAAASPDTQARTEKILENKRLREAHGMYAEAFRQARGDPRQLFDAQQQQLLGELDGAIAKAEQRAATASGRAKEGMQKSLEQLRSQREGLSALDASGLTEGSGGAERQEAALMESLSRLKLRGAAAESLLRSLSARHLMETAPEAFTKIGNGLAGAGERPTSVQVREARLLATDFLSEHYLHPSQEQHQTGHSPFSSELRGALEKTWQLVGGRENNPFVQAEAQLDDLTQGQISSAETRSITLVPAQGLLRVFSGDIGDACYSSRHDELARGNYPDLHSMVMVTNRGEADERFVGSALFIETATADRQERKDQEGASNVLVVRANNPRENLIQDVDGDALIKNVIDAAVGTAKKRGLEYVAVTLDGAGQSSSNRPSVSDYYQREFSKNRRLGLVREAETSFNGYDIASAAGAHPAVVIWSRSQEAGAAAE